MNINSEAVKKNTFDAIVIGSGISGGWAAKELCEKGLKTLVLERGRHVEHIHDYPTTLSDPWELMHHGAKTLKMKQDAPLQSTMYNFDETSADFFVKDVEHPYNQVKPYSWIRGYQTGGKSLLWGRQTYRWSDYDYEANKRDGIAIDWPVRYAQIAPWYSYVEKFAGISGSKENLAILPDSEFLPPMELNVLEKDVKNKLETHYNGARKLIIGRVAHLTQPHNGRGACQFRNLCHRGCPYGAYFSSQSATLPAAKSTGNLTLKNNSVVHSIIYDEKKQKAAGVRVIDALTKEMTEYHAKVIFVCAGTIASAALLLNSTSNRFPNGFGNDSEQLGHNLMDHHYHVGAYGSTDAFQDVYYAGRRPNGIYIPQFRNVHGNENRGYIRGFGYQGGASRNRVNAEGFGSEYKAKVSEPGDWSFTLIGFGEQLPHHDNKMSLNANQKDPFGLPMIDMDVEFKENELNMRKDMGADAAEMLEAAGLKNIGTYRDDPAPGFGIHDMGSARMGRDPKTSVLNGFNQMHACKNVFVTDGSFMVSSGVVNPSLSYMAFTARAVDYAVAELKKGNL